MELIALVIIFSGLILSIGMFIYMSLKTYFKSKKWKPFYFNYYNGSIDISTNKTFEIKLNDKRKKN